MRLEINPICSVHSAWPTRATSQTRCSKESSS